MKKIFLIISIVILFLIFIAIFSPIPRMIDRLLVSEKEVALWKKYAIDGNMTATSNLIFFCENKIEKNKWLNLYKKQRVERENEYLSLKKKSKEGNITAKVKIEELRLIGYF